jgi:hypothetical protein
VHSLFASDTMLKATIEQLTRRFAGHDGSAGGRNRLRERAEDLICDLFAALDGASLGEIAEARRTLERRRKSRTARPRPSAAIHGNGKGEADKQGPRPAARANGVAASDRREATHDPFDITLPSNLLSGSDGEANGKRRQGPRTSTGASLELVGLAARNGEGSHAARVSLREGEELLRTGGTGAVIKRVRS